VKYDFQREDKSEASGPVWLRNRLGVDFLNDVVFASIPTDFGPATGLRNVEELELIGSKFIGEALSPLAGLDRLCKLSLHGRYISSDGLEAISRIPNLAVLDLGPLSLVQLSPDDFQMLRRVESLRTLRAGFTGKDLSGLAELSQLRQLSLTVSGVKDNDLEHLANLTKLESLRLRGSNITDAGLKRLSKLTRLRSLDLNGCGITGAGLAHLQSMHQLRELDLSGNPISSEGLKLLSGASALAKLTLNSTSVNDAVIGAIGTLDTVREVSLQRCGVTLEQLNRLASYKHIERIYFDGVEMNDFDLPMLKELLDQSASKLGGGSTNSHGGAVEIESIVTGTAPAFSHKVHPGRIAALMKRQLLQLETINTLRDLYEAASRAETQAFYIDKTGIAPPVSTTAQSGGPAMSE